MIALFHLCDGQGRVAQDQAIHVACKVAYAMRKPQDETLSRGPVQRLEA